MQSQGVLIRRSATTHREIARELVPGDARAVLVGEVHVRTKTLLIIVERYKDLMVVSLHVTGNVLTVVNKVN
jgi:hypothetical protein